MSWRWSSKRGRSAVLVWTLLAFLVGGAAAFGLREVGAIGYYYAFERSRPFVYLSEARVAVQNAVVAVAGALSRVNDTSMVIPDTGKVIVADLELMSLSLYLDGQVATTVPIMAKGRPGTPWETPAGTYEVLTKKERHFSSIGEVWMPYNLQFFGNFFIHGWPTYDNGNPVAPGYSGGCIRLATEDAKSVYDFADPGTQVVVRTGTSRSSLAKHYVVRAIRPVPWVSARSYLVADLDTGEILVEKGRQDLAPIASVTKLMTALISLDAINQYQTTTVSRQAVSTYGTSGGLKAGDQITVSNLIYPLLLESSNDAAEVLAEHYGRSQFIKLMNDRAAAAGLQSTHFEDPSGLASGNVSTVEDLFRLARYIYTTKPFIFEVVAKARHQTAGYTWVNENELLGESYFLGGKNGFTDEAGQTMLSLWSLPLSSEENRRIAVVLLQSQNRKTDAEKLLAYLSDTVSYESGGAASRAATPAAVALATAPAPAPEPRVTLALVGDIMMDRGVKSSVNKHGQGDFNWLFEKVSALSGSDILFGNLEGPLSDVGKNLGNLYSFRMSTNAAEALGKAGFDIVSIANNHIGDWGFAAFLDTSVQLAQHGVATVGGGENSSDVLQPRIIEKNGLKIGFLAATDVGPDWLAAKKSEAGILLASDPLLPAAIKRAAENVDALVVSFHFGNEYEAMPSARQRALAEMAIDQGAKIVVGHHPHVTQPVETYGGGLIAYSLGNFIFDQYFSPETMRGMVLAVEIKRSGLGQWQEKTVTLSPEYQPSLN